MSMELMNNGAFYITFYRAFGMKYDDVAHLIG